MPARAQWQRAALLIVEVGLNCVTRKNVDMDSVRKRLDELQN